MNEIKALGVHPGEHRDKARGGELAILKTKNGNQKLERWPQEPAPGQVQEHVQRSPPVMSIPVDNGGGAYEQVVLEAS